jgi:hypothetical protein
MSQFDLRTIVDSLITLRQQSKTIEERQSMSELLGAQGVVFNPKSPYEWYIRQDLYNPQALLDLYNEYFS